MANSTQPSKSDRSYHKLQEQDGENVRDFEVMRRAVHDRFVASEGPRNMAVVVVTLVSSAECMRRMVVCSKCTLTSVYRMFRVSNQCLSNVGLD